METEDTFMEEVPKLGCLLQCLPHSNGPFWIVLAHSLKNFKEQVSKDPSADTLIRCICSYRTDYQVLGCYNFRNLNEALDKYSKNSLGEIPIGELLSSIAEGALKIGDINFTTLQILSRGRNWKVEMSPEEVYTILCNGFFCTFLQRDPHDDSDFSTYPRINFIRLFCDEDSEDLSRNAVKVEKLLCLLAYFEEFLKRRTEQQTRKLSYERRSVREKVAWDTLTDVPFGDASFSVGSVIENDKDALQVDFANKSIGGGVLGNGSVQEEIRFITCPEMIAAQLLTEHLGDDEVLFLEGATLFSVHVGYARSFKFQRLANSDESIPASVVAMDAMYFSRYNMIRMQYERSAVDRELHKCNVAFGRIGDSGMIASGKWGCGAFGGDPDLKLILQWMASSYHKRRITFHLPDATCDNKLAEAMGHLAKLIQHNNISVAQVYNEIIDFGYSANSSDSFVEVLGRKVSLYMTTEKLKLFRELPSGNEYFSS